MRKLITLIPVALATVSVSVLTVPDAGAQAWRGELPIARPWVRDTLPVGTLAYQRVPYPLALLAMPKGNMLDEALMTDANVSSLISIQQGLADNLASELSIPFAPLLLDHLRSPIEVVVMGLPAPSALIGATLNLRSSGEVEALIAQMSNEVPISLTGPLDDDGFGQLAGLPVPAFLHFDADSGRFALFGAQMATRESFAALLDSAAAPDHPMFALEAQIDSSGQGYFGWIDATQALQLGAMMMPPETMAQLRTFGLDRMRALAFGAGVANGKGRLKVLADLGPAAATRPLPVISNRITATAAGEPRSLFLLSLPSPVEFQRLESMVLQSQGEDAGQEWLAVKQRFNEITNTSIEEILSAIGPELMAISDDAGDYVALRVRDPDALETVLSRLSEAAGIEIEERRVDGQTIRYIAAPSRFAALPLDEAGEGNPVADITNRMRTRVYWTANGDYLYLAGVPQLLMERARLRANTSIANWLEETQRVDLSSSLLAGTGSVARVPALMYQAYLGMMQGLADVAQVEYDIWAMPTASQLDLPERGTLGFSVNLGEPLISLEMVYESHPAEFLFGAGGIGSIAAAGIVAAIAMPAYQASLQRAEQTDESAAGAAGGGGDADADNGN